MSLVPQSLNPRSLIYAKNNSEALVIQSAFDETRFSIINSAPSSSNFRFVFNAVERNLQIYTQEYDDGSVVRNDFQAFEYFKETDTTAVETFGTSITSNLIFNSTSPYKEKLLTLYDNNPSSVHEYTGFRVDDLINLRYQTPYSYSRHQFFTGISPSQSVELFRIQRDAIGNAQVGIGTTIMDAGVGLTVVGDTVITGSLTVNGLDYDNYFVKLDPATNRVSSNVMPEGVVFVNPQSNNTIDPSLFPVIYTSAYLRTTKNFGIGTRYPKQKLHVVGTTAITDRLGLGTLYPSARLEIVEEAASIPAVIISNTTGGDILRSYINNSSGGEQLPVFCVVGSHQGVGIGTSTVKITNALQVHGSAEITNTIIANKCEFQTTEVDLRLIVSGETFLAMPPQIASDARLKTDIQQITNALNTLSSINGYTYTMKSQKQNPAKNPVQSSAPRLAGVIAQELQQAFPEAVSQSEDTGMLSVRYDSLIPLLIESVNELAKRVTSLEKMR